MIKNNFLNNEIISNKNIPINSDDKLADLINLLPTNKNIPSSNEIHLVDSLFNESSENRVSFNEKKHLLILFMLILFFNSYSIRNILSTVFKINENSFIVTIITGIIIVIIYEIILQKILI
jgi:hypothetical protein